MLLVPFIFYSILSQFPILRVISLGRKDENIKIEQHLLQAGEDPTYMTNNKHNHVLHGPQTK